MIECLSSSLLNTHPNLSHGFTTRKGGVSTGLFNSLNAALKKEDNADHVLENRRRIAQHLGARPDHLVTLRQIHSNKVILVDRPYPCEERQSGDALVTTTPGLLIGIITADCVPILLADPHANVVAAVHAGWKGATSGIIKNTVKSMISVGAKRDNIVAAIGPCIWQASYQVDQGFYDQVTALSTDFAQFFATSSDNSHWQFDLPGFVHHQLCVEDLAGSTPSPADTYSDENRFFSFRRKTHRFEPVFGCSLSAIMCR